MKIENILHKPIFEKCIRYFIVGFLFLTCYQLQTTPDMRVLHETLFMLGSIIAFAFLLQNIWIACFLWWTVFLFGYYKFAFGGVYVTNVFCGCLLYYLCRRFFRKKHIPMFIKGVLWLGVLNIAYMVLQKLDFDFLYRYLTFREGVRTILPNNYPTGFFGSQAFIGCFICMLLPLVLSRRTWWGYLGGFGLLLPLYYSKSTLCGIIAILTIIYCLFFVMDKRIWCGILIAIVLAGTFYYIPKLGRPDVARFTIWKRSLEDYSKRWITGIGLDSFRNEVPHKKYKYLSRKEDYKRTNKAFIGWWDNPHCMYITILYEFGMIGMILFVGYLSGIFKKFWGSIKTTETVGLMGVALVVLLLGVAHFPIQIARFTPIIIPSFALLENSLN